MSASVQITAALESFHFDEAGYRALIRGPVAQNLVRRGIRVEASMKQHASGRPGPNVITGRLRGSITWRLGEDGTSPFVDVGTAVHYAPYVERRFPFIVPALAAARTT